MSTPQRLPIVNSDDGTWGDIIRQYLKKEHYDDGTDNAVNGGHQTVTIRAGTATAGTAPLKFTSGTLLTAPEAGAVEFNSDTLYFTITTSTTRKKVAIYNDASGATGDTYYRDSSGNFTRLGIGSSGQALTVSGGLPAWGTVASGTLATATKTTNYTVTTTDAVILADATSGNVTITLPAASGASGYRFYIKRVDNTTTNSVTITPNGSDTIDGFTGISVVSQYDTYELVSNGTTWYIIATNLLATETTTSTIGFRSVSTATQASAASVVVNKPTGTSLGDVLIAYFTVYPGATTVTLPAPTGWTPIGSLTSYTTADQIYSQAFYKVAGGSEPSSYTFTSTVAKPCDISVAAYTGVDTNNPVDVSSGNSGSSTTPTATAVTTTNANEMLLFLTSGFSGSISSGPANMTQRASYDSTKNYTYDIVQVAASSSGAITATRSGSDSWTVNLVALKPASVAQATIEFSEDFESGTNGSNVTTSNSGFSLVNAGGTVTFDTTHTVNGILSGKFVSTGAGGNAVYVQHTLSNVSTVYTRFMVYLNALPGANLLLCSVASTGGNADAADIRITTTGTVQVRLNGAALSTTTTTTPVGSWFMVEYAVDSTNSVQHLRLYSGLTTDTIQEVISNVSYNLGTMNAIKWGIIGTASATIWIDGIYTALDKWIGGSTTPSYSAQPKIDIFTSSGTWTKPTGARWCRIRLVGGGGAGGGAGAASASQWSFGDGGGGGEYGEGIFSASSLSSSETITVGTGGTGGTGAGGTGNTSSMGSHITAIGGGGGGVRTTTATVGNYSSSSTSRLGGTGGTGGDFHVQGGAGGSGNGFGFTATTVRGGDGGISFLSGTAAGAAGGSAGTTGISYGGGGSGAAQINGGSALNGGTGGAGIVIVETHFV
ncbi:MAG TPA: hypothetical protein VLF69_05130 [Candidatus Saccharimonadales bacterium]|nr:hypothetical protein [Candidatus Saccharimonadales bacterium]